MGVRTDIHRPAAINPAEYDFIAVVYHGGSDLDTVLANNDARRQIRDHMKRTGGEYSAHEHGGNCHICGACAMYVATFYHAPSNTYITTGEDCAAKLHMGADFRHMRRSIANAREALAGKRKANVILSDAGLDAAWAVYEAEPPANANMVTGEANPAKGVPAYREELIVKDMVGKLVKYGSISEKQTNFLRKLVGDIANRANLEAKRANLEAKRAAEKAAAADCPTGRVEITGTVIKKEYYDSAYGETLKMVVKDDSGFLVFGSVPSSIRPERGDRVKFTATVTPSDRDPKFGFCKRPSKASIL
ncbi:MAG: hypothetical protein ACREJM_02340 [Candidatus Saccharimonadales bacterium]